MIFPVIELIELPVIELQSSFVELMIFSVIELQSS